MKRIMLFLIVFCFLPKLYSEDNMSRSMNGFDVIGKIVGWVEDFRDAQLRMPDSLDELLEILPNRKGMFAMFFYFFFQYRKNIPNTLGIAARRLSGLPARKSTRERKPAYTFSE